ncbi:SusD/RagB family nutrient-binding outer membrane lipoprotein [Pedobacter panaciterrae]|uniref:SusD/RagB family nutrient-binding outer membrane lipoprotein n=1 Tax=Pedobacter panaciterrae TaxID=363849 RepID=A0ABU8NIU3_9SPHI|nr:SusD/RagB family nutrient-binding outer membrane lipoprotein [Pedobacter panaciterrae]NQX53722.1 SusD/RagB family nutrient-binding outer membrane lipoprotein [Pedobacter panaciterrae]
MKNYIAKSIVVLIIISLTSGCKNFDDLRDNPNNPNKVPPSLLFTAVIPTPVSSFSDEYINAQYHLWSAVDNASAVSYRFGSGTFSYATLRNIDKMEKEAATTNAPVYSIMAKFLRAYNYVEMTTRLGDIPLSEAMKGAEIPQPKYDTQKSVYIQCLNWLTEANNELGAYISTHPGEKIAGDFYYNGDLKSWQKAINAYTIRVLISLSKKADDADLKIKDRFSAIINNPAQYPLMAGLGDNMQITHRDEDGFRGNYNPNAAVYRVSVVLVDTYVNLLKTYMDPRLQKVADPTPKALAANPTNETAVREDFNSYVGADISASGATNVSRKLNGEISYPNERRFWNFIGQPSILIGYPEQELNIAEAAHLGWIGTGAKTHYDNGIKASMDFYGVDGSVTATYLTNNAPYLLGAAGLKRIHEQMYLALAENSGWESFFMTRRTGVPTYKFSTENSVTKIPVRWAYPTAEDTDNRAHYRAALRSQFGTEIDDRDQIMWLLK